MRISCLTATYGRFSCLRLALACFLRQTHPDKELIILNNHDVPIRCDAEGVRVLNEPRYPTLGDCRNRLLEEATGELIRTWDDDDLYLPWSLSQGAILIGSAPAFKPLRSWFCRGGTEFQLCENVFEASMVTRAEIVRKCGYASTGGDEHVPLLNAIASEGGVRILDCGWRASYVYTWGANPVHISANMENRSLDERARAWRKSNQDTGDGEPLTPDFEGLDGWWKRLVEAAYPILGKEDADKLGSALCTEPQP